VSEIKEREDDVRLSYSSLGTLQTCEQKFAHRKVYKTPVDADYEESEAFGIGKAFHQVLEMTNHTEVKNEYVDQALMDNNVKKIHKPLVIALAMQGVAINKASGLKIIKCELEISHKDYVGFIDAIGVDIFGFWWIVDLKSAGQYDEKILPRLPLDLQLNLYAYFKDHIAGALKLDPDKFAGCRYRQITKSKAERGNNETDAEFIKRLITPRMSYGKFRAPVEARDITIPAFKMKPAMAWEIIQENLGRAREIQQGEAPKKNFKACLDFFKPCEYFSQCHGHLFTEGSRYVKVHTINSYILKNVL
jgi:hypothetical protein